MKISPNLMIIVCFVLATSVSYGQPRQLIPDSLVKRLGEYFIKNKEAVGLSVGVYNNGKKYFYNYGTIEKGKTQKPTKKTIYEIGSITKTFVSLILANAVIEKKVKLDDDVRKYLDEDYPNLEYNKQPVTLLQLSNTTSGIPNSLPPLPKELTNAPPDYATFCLVEKVQSGYTEKDFLKALHNAVLDTVPGFKTRHSNGAEYLLTYILEKVYKTSIETLVSKYVLVPNKMKRTYFLASKSKSKLLAKGYNSVGIEMPYFAADFMKGVGGLNASTADLIKFIKLQLDTTKKEINLTHQKTFNAGWCDIGLSWMMYKDENGNHQFWADGGTYGFRTFVFFYPEINSGVVVLSNESDPSTADRLSDIAESIFKFMNR